MAADVRIALTKADHSLPSSWTWEWFTDVMDVEGGTQPPASEFIDEPRPGYVRLVQIRDFESDGHITFIPDSPKWRKCAVADVLIGRYGAALGRICTGLEGAYNVALAKVIPTDRVHLPFAYYLLKSDYFQAPLLASGGRSAQAGFNKGGLSVISLPLPPLPEQRAIAHILGTLDDKIELNRRMNETLEAMARALFKSWFVDFDPVRAKAEGRDPGLPKPLADLFPARLVDSELGEIPEGWQVHALENALSELEVGGRPKGGVSGYNEGVPSIGAESIVGLGIFDYSKTRYVPREFFDAMTKGHVKSRDVLLYKDGGRPGEFEPHLTLVGDGFPYQTCAINEHVYRLRAKATLGQNFLFFWLSSDFVMDEMRIKGTGVAIPGLNSTQVKSLTTLVPASEVVRAFDAIADSWVTRLLASCNESRSLATVRDALLPKLISGDLRLEDPARLTQDLPQ